LKIDDLAAKEREAREQLFWLNFKRHSGQASTPMSMRKFRRVLSRIKTIETEKQAPAAQKQEKKS
jgi:ribosomal protein L29